VNSYHTLDERRELVHTQGILHANIRDLRWPLASATNLLVDDTDLGRGTRIGGGHIGHLSVALTGIGSANLLVDDTDLGRGTRIGGGHIGHLGVALTGIGSANLLVDRVHIGAHGLRGLGTRQLQVAFDRGTNVRLHSIAALLVVDTSHVGTHLLCALGKRQFQVAFDRGANVRLHSIAALLVVDTSHVGTHLLRSLGVRQRHATINRGGRGLVERLVLGAVGLAINARGGALCELEVAKLALVINALAW
jgi:hypothetical protein